MLLPFSLRFFHPRNSFVLPVLSSDKEGCSLFFSRRGLEVREEGPAREHVELVHARLALRVSRVEGLREEVERLRHPDLQESSLIFPFYARYG